MPMQFNFFEVLSIITCIVVPLVIWGYSLQKTLERLLKMHETRPVQTILDEHSKLLSGMHQEHTRVVANLVNCISELSHYIQWLGTQQTGRAPPPFVRDI